MFRIKQECQLDARFYLIFVSVSLTTTQLIGPISMYLFLQSLNAVELLALLRGIVTSPYKLQKRGFSTKRIWMRH